MDFFGAVDICTQKYPRFWFWAGLTHIDKDPRIQTQNGGFFWDANVCEAATSTGFNVNRVKKLFSNCILFEVFDATKK
jgi:hypothetical protein